MKALIFQNKVIQIESEEFPVSPEMIWMESPEGCETGWLLDNGALIAPPAEPEWGYDKQRRNEYPSLGDQFDMQYWDQDNDTTTWKDAIAAVKTKWPKDNSGPVE